ncbi:MAG TPA: HEAT repeat domain-containing protein [Candidatus Acidoferrales bacterium]|nr:HEAT repeat domain-containing protein [Candidatus Acidoferrales bacterium]
MRRLTNAPIDGLTRSLTNGLMSELKRGRRLNVGRAANAARSRTAILVALMVTASLFGIGARPAGADEQPKFLNAKVETRSAAAGLDPAVRAFAAAQEGPAWIGYAAPLVDGRHSMCCGRSSDEGNCCGRCALESSNDGGDCHSDGGSTGSAKLEGPTEFFVLLRAAGHRIGRVRTFTGGCSVDAGGLRVVWLTDVKPAESVAVLSGFVAPATYDSQDYRSPASGAMAAIARHADPAADRAFASFIAPSQPEKLRSEAAFWLGSTRGAAGLHMLEGMAKNDTSTKVRMQVAFAYSVSGEPAATDDLIRLAKDDENAKVRGQGLFWLGQKAGRRAASAITDAIENDPDTATKRSAVFALSQLPKDEGVPLLIHVAKTNKNPEVRKQAFFWLGQANDPRVVDFFEEILKK